MLSWLDGSLYIGLPYALVALSFVITFQYLHLPDVTCASTFVLGAATAAGSVVYGNVNPFVALLLAALAGCAGGGLTALFHLGLQIDKLLSGILAAFALYSVNLLILHPSIPYGLRPTALSLWESWDRRLFVDAQVPLHPASIVFLSVVVVTAKMLLDLLFASEWGLCLRAMEDESAGETALRRLGLAPYKIKAAGLMLSNSLVAVAGALISMEEGAANVHRGFDVLITGLVAFLIGVKFREWSSQLRSLRSIRDRIDGAASYTTWAIVGPLVYFGVINLAYRLQIPSEYLKIMIAVCVAVAIGNRSPSTVWRSLKRADSAPPPVREPTTSSGEGESTIAELINITFGYKGEGDASIIRDLDLKLHRRRLIRLDGHNGSGKSTLARLIAGRLGSPETGSILFDGQDLTHDPDRLSEVVGFIDQDPRRELVHTLTVEENLALSNIGRRPSIVRRALSQERRERMLKIFGKTRFPVAMLGALVDELSGGQRQVINVLCLFVRRAGVPDLIFADEPFNNLDQVHVALCLELIGDLRQLGKCVVVATHSYQDALDFDQVIRCENGKLLTVRNVAEGSSDRP